jgi:hypothetical protein
MKSQNSMNQGFSYYFCLMIEGSGSRSVPLTTGSVSGSRRPKNFKNFRIRSRNTGFFGHILAQENAISRAFFIRGPR